jgi:hypothetical protein
MDQNDRDNGRVSLDLSKNPAPSRISKMEVGDPFARWNPFSYTGVKVAADGKRLRLEFNTNGKLS